MNAFMDDLPVCLENDRKGCSCKESSMTLAGQVDRLRGVLSLDLETGRKD